MNEMPRARYKESHKPINRDRRYEVDQITDGAASPKTVIPQEYWDDMYNRVLMAGRQCGKTRMTCIQVTGIDPMPDEAPF